MSGSTAGAAHSLDGPRPGGALRSPGDLLLHPAAITAIAVVLVNDFVLKPYFPGDLSGKLSDFAGPVYFPLLLVSIIELGRRWTGRDPWELTPRAVVVATIVVGAAFAAIKLSPGAADGYRLIIGYAVWPADALRDLWAGRSVGPPGRALLVEDKTDLVGLIVLPIPVLVARSVMGPASRRASDRPRHLSGGAGGVS